VATTRRQIRQDVGTQLGDMIVSVATAEGTTTSFTDANTLVLPTNEYKGRTIWFSDGTASNLEASRKINASATSSVSWAVALPAVPAIGDEAELWNLRGTGWEPQEINRLISIAHREAQEHLPIEAESDEFTWDADDPFLNIPENMIAVTGVHWQEPNTENWRTLPMAKRIGAHGYRVIRHNRTIEILGYPQYALDTRTMVIQGYQRESDLEDDTDETAVNREYLVARVCELACSALLMRSPEAGLLRDKLQMYRQESQVKRTMAIPRRALNVIRVD
jgi:hypothetical protein